MTKEEFYKLAGTRPEMPEASVYRLTIMAYHSDNKGYHKSEGDEWVLDLEVVSPMYFTSREKAEETLANVTDELTMFRKMHSAVIDRLPLDTGFRQMPVAWWQYDNTGRMVDHSVCSSFHAFDKRTPVGKFFGRREEEIRFKEGDFVEVYDEDPITGQARVKIEKIVKSPNTVAEEWEEFDKSQQGMGEYPFDGFYISDYFRNSLADNYLTGHYDEMAVKNLFSLTFPIPQEVKDEINREIEVFQNAKHCIASYENVSIEEMDKLFRGELTEEDIRKTHKHIDCETTADS